MPEAVRDAKAELQRDEAAKQRQMLPGPPNLTEAIQMAISTALAA